jgi:hypothetical protein
MKGSLFLLAVSVCCVQGMRMPSAPAAARTRVRESFARAPAIEMGVDAKSDWFSTTALVAEGVLAKPESMCTEEELDEIVEALNFAVQAHSKLRGKLARRLTKMRMEHKADWYLIDGLDH